MGLLRLAPRTADVVAGEEGSTTVRIDKECMHILFNRFPELKKDFVRIKDIRMEDSGWKEDREEAPKLSFARRMIKATRDFIIPW
jgi:hypothetical protein